MEQKIITNYADIDQWIKENGIQRLFLVCDNSIDFLKIKNYIEALQNRIRITRFDKFQPNPLYESVVDGVRLFKDSHSDSIVAIGGGSAMDVAKCIKLYSNLPGDGKDGEWLKANQIPNSIPFLAMPTTAGTGSESTKYAVVYYDGAKQSVTSENCMPDTILMDSSVLETLPMYQKKSTMCDALCHAIESFWSINSTDESKEYSKRAIELIIANMDGYIANNKHANANMLTAANIAGKAINITQTTAGHAFCYKITSLFGCAHGHAAILCDRILFPWMINNLSKCIDNRGEEYLKKVLFEIGYAMGCQTPEQAAEKLNDIFEKMEFSIPEASEKQYEELKRSVNPVRLKNHPITLSADDIDDIYHEILR